MAQKKLSDRFLIGEELGRGAYGQVYKGIDYMSGDTVAIKQISLAGIPSENLQSVMGEIDLLKTLNHKNIVKYIGSFKTRTHLYIILEYMENGSLASIIKPNKFGTFPESLVAVYIAQVLQGLQYLHEQGVVHRDIKGANILTTKDGLVKLADFGVAAKLGELEERRDDMLAATPVVGTPYWMAPEVIEMTQVTSSSDIWSVGCLIVELLTGCPPYWDMNAMSAMFRIVQDAMPPLPEDISPLLRDFLSRCFLKDAKLRPDARTLLQHEWLQHNRRTLRMSWRRDQGQTFRSLVATRAGGGASARHTADAHETINSVVTRMMAAADEEERSTRGGGGSGSGSGSGGSQQPAGPLGFGAAAGLGGGAADAAAAAAGREKEVERGGEDPRTALLAAEGAVSSSSPAAAPGPPSPAGTTLPYGAAPKPTSPHAVAAAASSSGAELAVLRAQQVTPTAAAAADSSQPPPPGSHITLPPLPPPAPPAPMAAAAAPGPLGILINRLHGEEPPPQQLLASQPSLPYQRQLSYQLPDGGGGDAGAAGGYQPPTDGRPLPRDLAAWTDGGGQAYDMLRAPSSRHVTGPYGAYGAPMPMAADAGAGSLLDGSAAFAGLEAESVGGTLTSQAAELRRKVRELVRSLRPGSLRPGSRPEAAAATTTTTTTSAAAAAAELESLIAPPQQTQPVQQQQQPMSPRVEPAAAALPPAAGASAAAEAKALFLSEGGVLVLLELLDTENQKAVEAGLDLLSALVRDDERLLESLSLVGLVPAVARFAQQPWPPGLRLKAAAFVHGLCFRRDATLQLFIAAGGLKQLCWMVADSVASEPSPLSHVAIQCLLQVLQCYATLPLNYICRILAHCGLLPRLYKLLKEVIAARKRLPPPPAAATAAAAPAAPPGGAAPHHGRSASTSGAAAALNGAAAAAAGTPGAAAAASGGRAMTLPAGSSAAAAAAAEARGGGAIPGPTLSYEQVTYLLDRTVYLLAVLSNADSTVKAAMASHDNLLSHLECMRRLAPPHLVELLRCLRNLTSDPAVLPAIKDAGAIACLVPLLAATPPAAAAPPPPPAQQGAGAAGGAVAGVGPAGSLDVSAVLPKSEVQMEALNALYNLCMYDRKAHLEAAASAGIIPHLCSFAAQGCAAVAAARAQRSTAAAATDSAAAPRAGAAGGAAVDPARMTPGSAAAVAAAAAQWPAVRGFVVPLLLGLVGCSRASRDRLFAAHGLDIFLHLLSDEDSRSVLGVQQALDTWLGEEHSRVEVRLVARDAVGHLVQLHARSCAAQDMQSKLDLLRSMLGRSSKLAVALAMGGLVPWLLASIQHAAPISRVKILDIVRILYEHYPRPKEFIMMYKIQDVLALLLKTHGRDADAVIQQAQRLLSAFDINVLL